VGKQVAEATGAGPTVLALDFDGVICDGLREYFLTAWQAHCQLQNPVTTQSDGTMTIPTPPDGLNEIFYRLRPVVESGWEMPLVIDAVLAGVSEAVILQGWPELVPERLQRMNLEAKAIAAIVDGVRDRWITTDLEGWLAEHRFYPGAIARLKAWENHPVHPIIISTKEGRFIRQLLQQQGLDLTQIEIFGKEVKQPKYQTLRQIMGQYIDTAQIWFVEDRLPTLHTIQAQPDLQTVQLFLADWGYNTAPERQAAMANADIHLLSLSQWSQDFPTWLSEQ
jgi:phosphoglycolate phosphatase-like HAD superfamily hydrolase